MTTLESIRKPIEGPIREFEGYFKNSMKTKVALLDKITHYIVKRKGKQMRPMFVFLTASLCGGITESTYRAAALIELLHTATLVHDDVVDDSNERRGVFSLNALWKNKIAVLVGDFLLSKGLLLALDADEFQLLKIVSAATREMSEGELLQIEKARSLDIDEAVYYEIIRKKTASLIAACCAAGAYSAGADEQRVEAMRLFGEKVGMAFQLKDDLFDYQQIATTGKPGGIDIKEQKMTLPLIYMLNQASFFEKRRAVNVVKNHNQNPDKVAGLIDQVRHSGGIDYAHGKMMSFEEEALQMLQSMPDVEARQSLDQLVKYTTRRNR